MLVEGAGTAEQVEARLSQIRIELERATQDTDIEVLRERLAKLVEQPGGDPRRRRHRPRAQGEAPPDRGRAGGDARGRVSEGIVAGGGTALLRAETRARRHSGLEGDYLRGADVIRGVLAEPLFWVATNAGYDGQAVIDQVRAMPPGHGLNALTGEFGDLFEDGVIDPLRVTRLTHPARRVGGGADADHRGAGRRGAHRPAGRGDRARVRGPGRRARPAVIAGLGPPARGAREGLEPGDQRLEPELKPILAVEPDHVVGDRRQHRERRRAAATRRSRALPRSTARPPRWSSRRARTGSARTRCAATYRISWSSPSAITLSDRPPARIRPTIPSAATSARGVVGIRPSPATPHRGATPARRGTRAAP